MTSGVSSVFNSFELCFPFFLLASNYLIVYLGCVGYITFFFKIPLSNSIRFAESKRDRSIPQSSFESILMSALMILSGGFYLLKL